MALWGNNDNVLSTGTVSLNYATRVVTGAGTSFGIAGGLSEGDVIIVILHQRALIERLI